jgi:hypothetical protein
MLKKFLLLAAALCIIIASATPVFAAPRRIAVLPIYNAGGSTGASVEEYLYQELDKNLHIPLNSTLNIAEFVPQDEVAAACAKINHHKPTAAFLQLVAAEVNADMAVCVLINSAYQYRVPRFNEDYLVSRISLQLIAYDDKLVKPTNVKAEASYLDIYSPSGFISNLVVDAAYQLFKKADLKQTIFPLDQ